MSQSSLAETLHAGILDLVAPDQQAAAVEALLSYLEILLKWNRTYNLTAVKKPAEMIPRHLLDSLSVLPWIKGASLLDAGSGAGLPGIPLAIAKPELQVTLLDSAGKKVRFQNHVLRELGLKNTYPVQERLETWVPKAPADEIISRAFSSLAAFAHAARHLAPTRLLAMKGKYPEKELEELPGWVRVVSVEKLTVPGLQEDRHLVIMSVNHESESNHRNCQPEGRRR